MPAAAAKHGSRISLPREQQPWLASVWRRWHSEEYRFCTGELCAGAGQSRRGPERSGCPAHSPYRRSRFRACRLTPSFDGNYGVTEVQGALAATGHLDARRRDDASPVFDAEFASPVEHRMRRYLSDKGPIKTFNISYAARPRR